MKLVASPKRPSPRAREQMPGVWVVEDDEASDMVSEASELSGQAAVDIVPVRTDVPESNPMHGKRSLPHGSAGQVDVLVDASGVLRYDGDEKLEDERTLERGAVNDG